MNGYDPGTTNPALLTRLGNWRDREAWVDFVTGYDRVIRRHCRGYRFDAETTEELCQRIWIDLARRMCTFRYDPGKTFRGWLCRLCHSRAIDLLRKQTSDRDRVLPPEGRPPEWPPQDAPADSEAEEGAASERARLLLLAEEVQEAVRRRVDERTWRVFWQIAVLGQPIRATAEAAGLSYYAAFAAQKRVGRMLREQGEQLLARGTLHVPMPAQREKVSLTGD
jgi:RNA polymerase sigma-70 factor (ECF subfamily)